MHLPQGTISIFSPVEGSPVEVAPRLGLIWALASAAIICVFHRSVLLPSRCTRTVGQGGKQLSLSQSTPDIEVPMRVVQRDHEEVEVSILRPSNHALDTA